MVLICFFLWCDKSFAQAKSEPVKQKTKVKLYEQRDIIDVIHKVFHKNVLTKSDSIERVKGELHISVIPAVAYTLMTRTAIVLAANGAFYTDDADDANLSLVNTSLAYTQNHQVIFPIHTSIWTKGNKYNLLGDWRFYRYPQYTYGLGGHTSTRNADLMNYTYITIRETLQKMIAPDLFVGLGYNLDYHWNITEAGLGDGIQTDYQKYGKTDKSISTGPSLKLLYDTRRNPINPQAGNFANIVYRPNLRMMGSDDNWQYLLLEFRKYIQLPGNARNMLAFWSYNWLTLSGKPPYLDLPSTAWDEFNNVGRGYIQNRLKGMNLLYLESEYRFGITKNGLLGGVAFVNAQCVSNWPGNKFDTVWPGVGAGLRIKVNKHSNTNMAIDYGIGLQGSGGLYFGLGEMF
ncbi:MAG TPA: BamA/TamA family outer membrane protein [Bacteroidia bacterium]|nr:BamA/TamA family outer membrane protein [Bacteroidia bacterium]